MSDTIDINTVINVADASDLVRTARQKLYDMVVADKTKTLFDSATNPRIDDTIGAGAKLGTIGVPAGIDITKTDGLMAGVDLTLLDLSLSPQHPKIMEIADRAVRDKVATVCVFPKHVEYVQSRTGGNPPPIAVVGFPSVPEPSDAVTATTLEQTRQAIADGAREIDMVLAMNFKDGNPDYNAHYRYIRRVVEEAAKAGREKFGKPVPVKVILENAYLNNVQKIEASLLSKMAGALFVKTSTGKAKPEFMRPDVPVGATMHDVALMRLAVGDTTITDEGQTVQMQVKAAGGISKRLDGSGMYQCGANRLGASNPNFLTVEEQAAWDKLNPPVSAAAAGY
jgi:deoxyribose-phosphate aldolase